MLNKQGKGKIDWTDYTWNPVSGCHHGCEYCYMRRYARRYPNKHLMKPTFHERRLKDLDKLREPSKIFVCSSGDLFGRWVPLKWIDKVLNVIGKHPKHTFQLLTKNPQKYLCLPDDAPDNIWIGCTIDTQKRADSDLYALIEQACRLNLVCFASFEPLLEEVKVDLQGLDWIIIGADSNRGAERPEKEWADKLIEQANRLKIPVFVKDNYGYPERHKKFPGGRVLVTLKELEE